MILYSSANLSKFLLSACEKADSIIRLILFWLNLHDYLLCVCIVNALSPEFRICIFVKFDFRLFALSLIHTDIIY